MTSEREVSLPSYDTLLTEAIKSLAVDSGIVTSPAVVGGNSLSDSSKAWAANIHANRLVKIIRGEGAGQQASILGNSHDSLIIRQTWLQVIGPGAVYVILNADFMQMLRDVFGGGANISATNPLETHDPKVGSLISYEGTTTANGAPAGASLIDAGLIAEADFDGNEVIITSGAYSGQARDIDGTTLAGTVTPSLNFGGVIVAGTTFVIAAIRTVPAEVAALTALVNALLADVGDASTSVLGNIYGILGDPATAFANMQGLIYYGVVTDVPGADQFTIPTLAGLGAGKFSDVTSPYWAFVFRDAGGIGGAPQGERQAVTTYDTVTGVFTTAAFTAAVAVDDEMLILHPGLAAALDILASLAVPAADAAANVLERDVIGNKTDTALYAVAANASLMRYIKALVTAGIAIPGAVSDAGPGITDFDTDLAEATDDHYNGGLLMFTAGPNIGQAHTVDNYTGGTRNVSFRAGDQWTDVPVDGNAFIIIPSNVLYLLTDLMAISYGDRVYFDEDLGIAGTAYPVGTAGTPSDVIADVITICAAHNIRVISVHGALTLGAIMEHYTFTGFTHEDVADILSLGGQDVDGSLVENLIVTGAQGGTGFLTLVRCIAFALTLFNGRMEDCDLYGSAMSFADGGFIDLNNCQAIHGVVTVTVQAPSRGSIKQYSGNLTLTAQDGGVMFVRGFKGDLIIDLMTGGTNDIVMNGGTITINANCTGGTVNIYGNAVVIDNSGGTTVNDYTKETMLGRVLLTMDFWSDPVEEKAVTGAQVTAAVGAPVTVAGLPGPVVRAIVMMKFRMVENTNAAENSLDCAAPQPIQVDDSGNTGWVTALDFVDEQFKIAATTREGGDVLIGDNDVSARVDGNDTYDFQWLNAKAHLANIQFNDIQMGIRIWYSI